MPDLWRAQYMWSVTRFPIFTKALATEMFEVADMLDVEDYAMIAKFPELAGHVGSEDFQDVAQAMFDGTWFKQNHAVEMPDYADTTVDFGGGE